MGRVALHAFLGIPALSWAAKKRRRPIAKLISDGCGYLILMDLGTT